MKKLLMLLGLIKSQEKPAAKIIDDDERWDTEGVTVNLTGEQYGIITIMTHYSIQYISNSTDLIAKNGVNLSNEDKLWMMETFRKQLIKIQALNLHMMDNALVQYPNILQKATKNEYSKLMEKVNGTKAD